MYYFLYKLNYDSSRMGTAPYVDDETTHLGLATYQEWFLGKTENPEIIYRLWEYNTIPITEEIAEGFKLLGVDNIVINEETMETRELNRDEIALQSKAQEFMEKLDARSKVNFKEDFFDSIADLNKRLDYIEKVIRKIIDLNDLRDPLLETFVNTYNYDLSDEDFEKIKNRRKEIIDMLSNYYNTKKKGGFNEEGKN